MNCNIYCIPSNVTILDCEGSKVDIGSWVLYKITNKVFKVKSVYQTNDKNIVVLDAGTKLIKVTSSDILLVTNYEDYRNIPSSIDIDGKCSYCSTKLSRNFNFCPYCGRELV